MRTNKINGLPIVDAKKRIKIAITKRDCKLGKTKDPGACAAARAILRQTHCKQARVHLSRTYVQMGKKWVRYHTPHSIRSEVISFDRGAKFSPGVYTLSPMSPTNKLGSYTHKSKHKNKRTGKKRAPYHTVHGVRTFCANR